MLELRMVGREGDVVVVVLDIGMVGGEGVSEGAAETTATPGREGRGNGGKLWVSVIRQLKTLQVYMHGLCYIYSCIGLLLQNSASDLPILRLS